MNYLIWGLGSLAIAFGLGFQWIFWSGFDLPELSNYGRRITFIRRSFANLLIVGIGLILFAIPASTDDRWRLTALSCIVALLLVVLLLAAWDWVSINIAVRQGRDRAYHDKLKQEFAAIQEAALRQTQANAGSVDEH